MRLKPSDAKDLMSFWHSVTDINQLMTYSDEELEPQFDPLDPKLIKKVDWEELREVLDAFWDQSEGWKRLISRNIENPSLTKFVNFYIYFHIDSIAQEILEGADKSRTK